jgi:hypothetical protein
MPDRHTLCGTSMKCELRDCALGQKTLDRLGPLIALHAEWKAAGFQLPKGTTPDSDCRLEPVAPPKTQE